MSGLPYLRKDLLSFIDMHIKSKHFSIRFIRKENFAWTSFSTQNCTVRNYGIVNSENFGKILDPNPEDCDQFEGLPELGHSPRDEDAKSDPKNFCYVRYFISGTFRSFKIFNQFWYMHVYCYWQRVSLALALSIRTGSFLPSSTALLPSLGAVGFAQARVTAPLRSVQNMVNHDLWESVLLPNITELLFTQIFL